MKGVVFYELTRHAEIIAVDVYCQQPDRVHEALHPKCRALANRKHVILQNDISKMHSAKQTQEDHEDRKFFGIPYTLRI